MHDIENLSSSLKVAPVLSKNAHEITKENVLIQTDQKRQQPKETPKTNNRPKSIKVKHFVKSNKAAVDKDLDGFDVQDDLLVPEANIILRDFEANVRDVTMDI